MQFAQNLMTVLGGHNHLDHHSEETEEADAKLAQVLLMKWN